MYHSETERWLKLSWEEEDPRFLQDLQCGDSNSFLGDPFPSLILQLSHAPAILVTPFPFPSCGQLKTVLSKISKSTSSPREPPNTWKQTISRLAVMSSDCHHQHHHHHSSSLGNYIQAASGKQVNRDDNCDNFLAYCLQPLGPPTEASNAAA